jgi:hypothetical protein
VAPRKLGRYEIKDEIGHGGVATVSAPYVPRFDRNVALNVLPREFLGDPRIEPEAWTISGAEKPATARVSFFGNDEGQPYLFEVVLLDARDPCWPDDTLAQEDSA